MATLLHHAKKSASGTGKLLYLMKEALLELKENDPLRMAGATAFFTTFALPPILIILIQLFGLIVNPAVFSSKLTKDLSAILGPEGAAQINMVVENIHAIDRPWYITIAGFLFLLVVATTLFSVVKNSLDQIWKIKVQDRPGITFRLNLRLRSMGIILLAGLLFIIGLVTEGFITLLGSYVVTLAPGSSVFYNQAFKELFFIGIVTVWFTVLFRFLTDGRPVWNLAILGGFFTAVLFDAGKLILRWLLTYNNISTIYGASGSIVLIMLFVFYSSIIFYYGGAFIKVVSVAYNKPIMPLNKAFRYEVLESKMSQGDKNSGQYS